MDALRLQVLMEAVLSPAEGMELLISTTPYADLCERGQHARRSSGCE